MDEDMIVGPNTGHIDAAGEAMEIACGVTLEASSSESMLHIQVARGGIADEPFAVAIHLTPMDAVRLSRVLSAVAQAQSGGAGDWKN